MYDAIVVGTDGSESATMALQEAIALARTCGARLHVVCATRSAVSMSGLAASAGIDPGFVDLERHEREAANRILRKAQADAEAEGLEVSVHTKSGNAAEAILDIAEATGADLIVVGNKGLKGPRRFLGSVPANVAHHATCRVLIVPTT